MTNIWTRTLRGDKGFTLLEVVVSLALIATALVAVFRLHAQNLDLQTEAQFITTGRYLAQERLAEIASRAELIEGTDSGDFGELFPYFSFEEEVSSVEELEGLFRAEIRIVLEQRGYTKDMKVETYLYRPGS